MGRSCFRIPGWWSIRVRRPEHQPAAPAREPDSLAGAAGWCHGDSVMSTDLLKKMAEMKPRFKLLRDGDRTEGIPPATDPRILREIREREEVWDSAVEPALKQVLDARTGETWKALAELDKPIKDFFEEVE